MGNTDRNNIANSRLWDMLQNNMGDDILQCMHDDNVFEVIVNPDGKLWVDTFDRGFVDTGVKLMPENIKRIIYGVASLSDQVIDLSKDPSLQADIPASHLFPNARFQAELPAIVESPSFNIRKHSKSVFSLDNYVEQGTMTERQKEVVIQLIHEGKNIIAAGGTKSGKTTLLNAILAEVSTLGERIITIEDTRELNCTAPNKVALFTTDYVDMDSLLRKTLRLSPNRIVVGEVRGKETLTLIDAWSTGHRGGCSTVHSNSAIETLYRLEEMISRVSLTPQQAAISRAVDAVVYIRYKNTNRKIEEIMAVDGFDNIKKEYIAHQLK